MLQKIRKQMAEQRVKDLMTPPSPSPKKKTPTPKMTTSPRIRRASKRKTKGMTKGNAKKIIKAWIFSSFEPTSDYYGETIVDADLSRDLTITTIPKLRKRLAETISATPANYVKDLLAQSQDDVPEEALALLTDDEAKKIYVSFEKSRIRKIGKPSPDGQEDEWTFRLKNSTDELEAFMENGKRCAAGKVLNTITKRCTTPARESRRRL